MKMISFAKDTQMHKNNSSALRTSAVKSRLNDDKKMERDLITDELERCTGANSSKRDRFSVVSLFSGAGGMDLGFIGGFEFLSKHYAQLPFDIIYANELSPHACKTYRMNFEHPIIEGDIYEHLDELPDHADVVIGGFPCQDISINGKMASIQGKRSGLYSAIVEAVRKVKPKVLVVENVGSLLMKKHKSSLDKIIADFSNLGYQISYQLYSAEQYAVPQTRERVFIVGVRHGVAPFCPPQPLASKPITAQEALYDLENKAEDKAFSHVWSKAKVSGEQGNRCLLANRPGYTIRAECHGNIQFHYSLSRRISMREAARLQSFPDSFTFACGIRETERQIGNAVPPVLAWYIARSVLNTLTASK